MGELAVWQNPTEVVVVHDRCTNVGRVLLAGDPARHKLNVGNLVIQEN
jgi:predicted nicotinamide N-methyase